MADYPLPKFHFRVAWAGATIHFSEVTGIDFHLKPVEYYHRESKDFSKIKMPGLHKFSNITLKRGKFDKDYDYHDWIQVVTNEKGRKNDVMIEVLNEKSEPVGTWKAVRCFPVKVTAPDLKAEGNDVAVESIEFSHEGLTLLRPDKD